MAMAASLGQKGPQPSSSTNQRCVVASCTYPTHCGYSGASGYDEDEALARAVAASLQEDEKQKHKRQQSRQQAQQRQQQVNSYS